MKTNKRLSLMVAVSILCALTGLLFGGCPPGDGGGNNELPAPSTVTASGISKTSITIQWAGVSGAARYTVYSGVTSTGIYHKVDTTERNSYTNNDLPSASKFYYKVTAVGSDGTESPMSEPTSASTWDENGPIDLPPTPSGFAVTVDQPSNKPVASWDPVPDAVGYYPYRGTTAGTMTKLSDTPVSATSYTDTTANAGTTYFYSVAAVNSAGESAVCAALSVTTMPAITSFSFANLAVTGTINGDADTITVMVPTGTAITALVPTIVYGGTSMSPTSGTARNFSSPVQYTVTAQDGTQRTYTVTVAILDMVLVPAGEFAMGSPASESGRKSDEGPRHQVTISRAFYIGKYEVTQKEWLAVMGTLPSYFAGDNLPVESVSWYDVIEYCNRLSQREGLTPTYTISGTSVTWNKNANGYRLPTEAEWEYACRAGTTTSYSSGNSVDDTGWYNSNSGDKSHEIGGKQANAWGLYDMHGNVWEWCWDWYGSYGDYAQTDPRGATSGDSRVFRGGSWVHGAESVRSAYRAYDTPGNRGNDLGFRLVRPQQAVNPCLAPSGLEVTVDQSTNKPVLSYKAVAGAAGYNFYRGITEEDISIKLNDMPVAGLSYTDTTASGGATYFYSVAAIDSTGVEGIVSAAWQVTIVPPGMVLIPAGTFTMGSPTSEAGRQDNKTQHDETQYNVTQHDETQHNVTISKAFFMGKYEVSVGDFRQFVNATGYKTEAETSGSGYVLIGGSWEMKADANWKNPYIAQNDNHPVVLVSWNDAVRYCNWKSEGEGLTPAYTIIGTNITWNRNASGYRLPTEAEWEFACRAGTTTACYTGNSAETLSGYANVADQTAKEKYTDWTIVNIRDGYAETAPVGSFMANAWGLHDMHGNVWEWCWDWYGDYVSGSQTDPSGAASGASRVTRGGSWVVDAVYLRSALRYDDSPGRLAVDLGFRLVRP